ncbi:hypothetical protein ccbrp13_22500 [Ktedonobacteria bacterium brp13]|nr:hypothetical protein ccbrp13_22500 [Ktedonobacteria bacterium brp13]
MHYTGDSEYYWQATGCIRHGVPSVSIGLEGGFMAYFQKTYIGEPSKTIMKKVHHPG